MKKRKTYEISVIDKTYSKTISDETKFYTSDTALELVFKLKETEYTFESAEIVLLNIDDRSLVTRPVSKVNNDFAYELEDDIIDHYGEWRGQLRFEKAGEIYVSSPVKFRIENDLSNERPPQLSDVQSWVSLKRYADSLVDELKQAVDEAVATVEAMDDTFKANELDRDKAEKERQARFENAESQREKGESVRVETFQTNEINRQSQFETAEQSRQDTFETNEIERNETFKITETARQAQELEREKSESQRQTVFDNNEASRFETFNANEATRQENETVRQQAETQRATAESSRVSAEAQRKADHENRIAELAIKADKVVLKNLVKNGDFSDGLNSWGVYGVALANSTRTVSDNPISDGYCLKVYRDNNQTGGFGYRQSFSFDKSSVLYVRVGMLRLSTDGLTSNRPAIALENPLTLIDGKRDIYDTWQYASYVINKTTIDSPLHLNLAPNIASGGLTTYYNEVILINLTDTFGAGNEPTKEEMDELINVTGYIDGAYALNNKEMLIWTLSLVRNNRNAITVLGGTI